MLLEHFPSNRAGHASSTQFGDEKNGWFDDACSVPLGMRTSSSSPASAYRLNFAMLGRFDDSLLEM
jgi:hypothetical protein